MKIEDQLVFFSESGDVYNSGESTSEGEYVLQSQLFYHASSSSEVEWKINAIIAL